MDRVEQIFAFDRSDSFPKDRAYPSQSRGAPPHIAGRSTNDSLLDNRRLHREGTGDFEPRSKPNKRLRYIIPLRYKKKLPTDEENGFVEEKGHDAGDIGRETSRGSVAFLPHELLEIVSTKWVPDDEGREIVTLTIKDGTATASQAPICCESRWRHIESDSMTFRKFYNQVMRVPGLEDDDLALVGRLLNKVQKTCEKQYVHGRYLKPLTLVYEGEDPDQGDSIHKTATFVSLPIFTTECPRRHTSTREFDGHPVRALLQSRYRLESTRKRDKDQVITKVRAHEKKDHVVHVPQIWALIINKYTIITCAPLDTDTLRGDTIKLMSYADAQLDEATWSVHFVDSQGNVSYLPLRYCKSWFSLVKHISDDILKDEYNLVRDQLLKDGPLYRLVTKDDTPVNAESWPKMVEEKKTEVIQIRLVDNQGVSNRLLVTACDSDGNEVDYPSDTSSDTSSIFSDNGEETDASGTSMGSLSNAEIIAPTIKKLRRLRCKLREAVQEGDSAQAEHLRDRKIPELEEKILKLTAEGMDMNIPKRERSKKRARVIVPDNDGRWRRSSRQLSESPPLSPRSRSVSRAPKEDYDYSRSVHDLSLNHSNLHEHTRRSHISHNRNRSISRPRHVWHDEYEFPMRSHTRSRPHSILSRPNLSRAQSQVLPRNRWDDVRSRVLNGQPLGGQDFAKDGKDDVCYKPSDKQLARSRWELLRTQILAGGLPTQSHGQAAAKPPQNGIAPKLPGKLKTAIQSVVRDHESPIKHVSPVDTLRDRNPGESEEKQKKKVSFGTKTHEVKPKLKRLINRAHKDVSTHPEVEDASILRGAAGPRNQIIVQGTQDIPIFLWSTELKSAHHSHLPSKISANPAERHAGILKTLLKTPEEINRMVSTSKMEEVILHTVTTEVHSNLKKPKKASPEYRILYEKTPEKGFVDVSNTMNALAERSESSGETAGVDGDQSSVSNFTILVTKLSIFDSASKILHAFVPQSFDAPVVSKYWGALQKLLCGTDEDVLEYVNSRLKEICDLIRSIQMGVRTDDGSKQARYQIPRALPVAFQHLVMLLVVISNIADWSEYSWMQMESNFDNCESLLVEGRKQLILMIHTDDYRESAGFQAVDSEALLSLILANLVDNLSTEREFHLTEIYSEYTTKVQSMVRDSASVKVYDDIKLLREELDVIKMTLKQQDDTLRDFKSTMNITYGVASLSISVIDRMLESIEQRIDDFDELQIQAETARFLAAQSISLKAESNNKAIIVFTVVTIIFLPLSFVTSYLGMNTSDLRTMQSGQTLFWAIGAPVAFVVLSAAILAAFYGTLTLRLTGRAWRGKEKPE